MRKFMFFIMILVICVIPHFSLANEAKSVSLISIDIMEKTEEEISGYFILENDTNRYLPKVSYILSLETIDEFSDGTFNTLLINRLPAVSFEMTPGEEKKVVFNYPIPTNLPKNDYFIRLSVAESDLFINESDKSLYLGKLGNGEEFLNTNLNTIELLYKMRKEDVDLILDVNKKTEIKLSLNSTFKQNIKAMPKISVYKEDVTSKFPVITTKGEVITFNSGEDTKFSVKIPEISVPGKYLIKLVMFDGDKQVSNEFEFSCYVGGENVSILNSFASLEKVDGKEKVFVNIDFLSNKANKYDVFYKFYKNDGTIVSEDEIELDLEKKYRRVTIPIVDMYQDGEFTLSVKKGDKILTTHSIKMEREKFITKTNHQFIDVSGKKYEDAIGILADFGILSGYPDGTFLPDNNITRAEFTTIAAKFAEIPQNLGDSSFTDVPEGHWAKGYINAAYKNGYISGYGNGIFKPNNNVTYQEVATILVNILEYPREKDFKNIKIKEMYEQLNINESIRDRFYNLPWPYNYIEAATNLNIWKGIEETDFSKPSTRKDVALMVFNAYFQK